MMNIQFMGKENEVTVKDNWTGKDTIAYIPNFDELVKNASCEEEVKAIREIEERMNARKGLCKGFAFQIVFMQYAKALEYNKETRKQEWVMKWRMMQHPWYETIHGVKHTKEQMVEEIEKML